MPKRPAASQSGPPHYQELASCTFLGRQRIRLSPDEVPVCQCKPCCQGGSGCGDDCQNRHTNHECHPEYCACGQACQNQQVQQHRCVKTGLQHMGDKGWGLVALQSVKAGSFVIEYIGEVVSADQAAERSIAYHQEEQPHTYFMNLSPLEIIDATCKGNRARFINHSCQPNCETQKWMIDGETCICIFALRDIAVGEELTYNYHLQWGGGKRIRCHCGAAKCQGYLEADSAQNRAALSMEADSGLDDAGYPLVDPCLETYDSDQDVPFASAGAGSAHFSQNLLVQPAALAEAPAKFCSLGKLPHKAGIDSIMLGGAGPSMHSPDASATLTGRNGSGPCSDASDITSSHPSDLPIHPHKRVKLSSVQPAQVTAGCHASTQHAPHPDFSTWSTTAEAFAPAQGLPGAAGSLTGRLPGNVLFPGSLSPPSVRQNHLGKLTQQAGDDRATAPPYTPCIVPGLTAAQEVVKAEQEAELAETLRHQENMFVAGYKMDDFGELQLPRGQYTRMLSMKVVFAQRWQHEAQAAVPAAAAAPLSMKQLLDEAVQLECEQPLYGDALLHHGGALLPSQLGAVAPVADGKPPIRFKLSEVKNAMRKAELGGPETSSISSGQLASTASDVRHTAWQVEQLSNTPLLNNLWVEHHIDRCNMEFDDSYWSMLENLST